MFHFLKLLLFLIFSPFFSISQQNLAKIESKAPAVVAGAVEVYY